MKNRLDFYQVQLQVSNAYTVPFPILITIAAIRIDPHYTFFFWFLCNFSRKEQKGLGVRYLCGTGKH